jgi:HupE / UreJ protein
MIHDLRTAFCLAAAAAALWAHEIPNDVTVRMLVKPSGSKLRLSVRVPLKAMRDMEFPEQGRTGFLDLEQLAPRLPDAVTLWISNFIAIQEDGAPLSKPQLAGTRVSLPSDREFNFAAPMLANSANVIWNQVNLDVLLEYQIRSDRARFSIRPGLEKLGERVVTALVFEPPGGAPRAFEFEGDPGFVALDPRWQQAAARFVSLGFRHILDGADHLLFLLCLVIPFRRLQPLIVVVTGFTIAHSVTLIGSAYGLAPGVLWFPPLIETLIAASIVFMALENIAARGSTERRWMMALSFGLVHGFGFSFALRETLQFAGAHHLSALVAFNVGVELGQLLVLLLLVPLLDLVFRRVVPERMGVIILSAFVAHTGWHWLLERWEVLRKFNFEMPPPTAALGAGAIRWLIALLIFGAAARWIRHRIDRNSAASYTLEKP